MRLYFYFFAFIILFTSCVDQGEFQENITIEDAIWNKKDTLQFKFTIEDTTVSYDIFYDVRYSYEYPYENLYLIYEITDSNGVELEKNLQWMNLFHNLTGEAYGSGIGSTFDYRIKGIKGFKFKNRGAYTIRLNQEMRKNELPGLQSIGIKIEKTK